MRRIAIVDEKTCRRDDCHRCEGVGRVQLRVCNGDSVVVDVYVVDFKPLGFEFILGINGISALIGVTIFPSLATRFGSAKADEKPVCAGATKVKKPVCASVTKKEKPVCAGATNNNNKSISIAPNQSRLLSGALQNIAN